MIVLIPSYEPDGRLIDLVDALRADAPGACVVLVDDGSGPLYADVFEQARRRGCTVLTHVANRGKGAALKTGFQHASRHLPGHSVVCADADGQHRPADVLRVAAAVEISGSTVLGARRFTGSVPARSRIGNTITSALFRIATRRRLLDTQTGLRGYPAGELPWLQSVAGDRFEYELNLLLQAVRTHRSVQQVEIETIYLDANAASHFRPLVDSARIYLPLLAFLLSSLSAFLIDSVALVLLFSLTGLLLPAVIAARLISGVTNFMVNRRVVPLVGERVPLRSAARRYAALAIFLICLNYLLLRGLIAAGLGLLSAKLVTEVTLVALSYLAQRYVVFRTAGGLRVRGLPRRRPVPAAPPSAPRSSTPSDAGSATADQRQAR